MRKAVEILGAVVECFEGPGEFLQTLIGQPAQFEVFPLVGELLKCAQPAQETDQVA